MLEIKWENFGRFEDRYIHGTFRFVRKKPKDCFIYEIWENGALQRNNLTYWEFMQKASKIISNERLQGDIWK